MRTCHQQEDTARAAARGAARKTRQPGRRLIRSVLSYGVAGACLYWVFHDIGLRELLGTFSNVRWWLVVPAVALDLLVYVCAGWEWKILLRPMSRVSMRQTTQAILAGRFANDVLPVHIGYVVRLYLVSLWTKTKVASLIPSLLVERLFDGLWLAVGIGVTAAFFHLPGNIAHAAEVWAAISIFGIAMGAVILLRKRKRHARGAAGVFRWKWTQKFRASAGHIVEELRAIGHSRMLPAAVGISILKLSIQCLAFLFILWAYRFDFSFWIQLAAFFIAYLGISMPSTPASVGVFQLFCVAGLEMFHVPKPAATGFALLAFAVLTIPLSVAGFFAFAQSGLTFHQVRNQAEGWKRSDSR